MYCSKCGKEIDAGSKCCYSCGSKTIKVEDTELSSSPSVNTDTLKTSNVNDMAEDEPLFSSKIKAKAKEDPIIQAILKYKRKLFKPRQRSKWIWV